MYDWIVLQCEPIANNRISAVISKYYCQQELYQRLDKMFGTNNWKHRYSFENKEYISSLSFRNEDEWITKCGTGITFEHAFKDACNQVGIGRGIEEIKTIEVNGHLVVGTVYRYE